MHVYKDMKSLHTHTCMHMYKDMKSLHTHACTCIILITLYVLRPPCTLTPAPGVAAAGDPRAHVGDGVHFHDFTFAPEAGKNFER